MTDFCAIDASNTGDKLMERNFYVEVKDYE